MKLLARLTLLIPALPSVAALLLSTAAAVAQGTGSAEPGAGAYDDSSTETATHCKLITATRGGSAELVPESKFDPDVGAQFPFTKDDSSLNPAFRFDSKKRSKCMGLFGIQTASSAGASGAGAAGAAAASGGVVPGAVAATGAGLGAGGLAAGGAVAFGGLGILAAGALIGVVTAGGGGNGPGAPTETVTP